MATGKQYTLSLHIKLQGESVTKRALDALSNGLSAVREGAKKAVNWVGALFRSQMQTSASARHLAVASTGMAESAKKASAAVNSSARAANIASASWRGLGSVIGRTGSLIRSGLLLPFRAATAAAGLLKGALLGLAGVAVSAWLQVKGAMAALRPAAEMEQYSIQLEVLTKSAAVASRRLAQLKEYARTTNFSPKEVIEASNLMQAFGLWTERGMRRLRAAGDAANAFGKSITEVVTAMNYLSSGRSGEAFEALSRIGVTRQALKPFGLEFKKSGELITEPKKAVDIVFAYLEKKFGGMTARQGGTWKGALQKLGGEVYNSFSEGMGGALKPMTAFVNNKMIPAVNALGKALKSVDWRKTLATPLSMIGGLLGALRLASNPSTRATGLDQLRGIVRDVVGIGKAAINGLGAIAKGLLKDGAAMLEQFVTGGGVQAVLKTLFGGLVSAFRFGSALVKTVLDGFSAKFKSDLISSIPGWGKTERQKQEAASIMAMRDIDKVNLNNLVSNAMQRRGASGSLFDANGNVVPYKELSWKLQGVFDDVVAGIKQDSARYGAKYDDAFVRRMGWNKPRQNIDYFKDWDKPLKDAAGSLWERVGGFKLTYTREAVNKATGDVIDSLGVFSRRLRRLDLMDDVQARRRALRQTVNKELDKLKKQGWDSKGRERDTERGLRARERYVNLRRSAIAYDTRLAAMLPNGGKGQAASPQIAQRGNPQAARYIPPQVADKQKQRGANAAKEAEQAAKDEKRDMADKANIQSAVYLDDIRRYMSRLVAILGQDIGGAGVPATPQ